MKKIVLLISLELLLTACQSTMPAPIPSETPAPISIATDTLQPTATSTPEPSPTPTPLPLEGRLFFDMNGSGLRDEATFNYDPTRLTDERQPLQPDLLVVITSYVQARPELKTGDLITIEEPGLSNYKVCVNYICDATDVEGKFSIATSPSFDSSPKLTITDPNKGTPALEMRYINQWNKAVVIPAFEISGVQVPEQHLNDTVVKPLGNGISINIGTGNNIGLMQGAFKGPFYSANLTEIYIWGYFDVFHNTDVCNGVGTIPDGKKSSYDGRLTTDGGLFNAVNPKVGVGDGHTGYDFRAPLETWAINAGPAATVMFADTRSDGENFVILLYKLGSENLASYYGHLSLPLLVTVGEKILPGQIVGLTDHSGSSPYYQLHWDLAVFTHGCTRYLPVFYSDIPGIYLLIEKRNDWTVFNLISYGPQN